MATVYELARDVLSSISGTDAAIPVAVQWVENRYKEMVNRVRFRHLRQVGELSLPAVEDDGTVTCTRGSTSVTGSSTTWVTDIGSGSQEYYYFRTLTAWYKISTIGGETSLTLSSAFAEDDVSDGSYDIVKRHHPLASDARWMGDFYHTRLRRKLISNVSLEALNIRSPGRTLIGNIPQYVVQVGVDSNGYVMVEVYPPPEKSEIIHYIYWQLPTALTVTSTLPSVIDPYTLKEGVLIDLYRYEKSRYISMGNVEQAGLMRNEEKAQNAIWQRAIRDAIRASRGSDDLSIILDMNPGVAQVYDQQTARDYVRDNWSR